MPVDTSSLRDTYVYTHACLGAQSKAWRVSLAQEFAFAALPDLPRHLMWNTPMFDLAFELRRNFHRKSPPSQRDRRWQRRPAVEVERRRGRCVRIGLIIIPCNDDEPRPTSRTDGIDCLSIFTHLLRHKAVRERRNPDHKTCKPGWQAAQHARLTANKLSHK